MLSVVSDAGIELVLESFRFSDIIRWNRGPLMEQVWNGFYVPALDKPLDLNEDGKNDTFGELTWLASIPRKWNEKFYLYPILTNDIQLNPKLGQNPGW